MADILVSEVKEVGGGALGCSRGDGDHEVCGVLCGEIFPSGEWLNRTGFHRSKEDMDIGGVGLKVLVDER